jgi:hypothetical protein
MLIQSLKMYLLDRPAFFMAEALKSPCATFARKKPFSDFAAAA